MRDGADILKAGISYSGLLAYGESVLAEYGIEESKLDAWYLFSKCFSMDRASYFLQMQDTLPEEKFSEAEEFLSFIERRGERIPLQQILCSQEFMGLEFFVNNHVLIPRQDTETLVESVLEEVRDKRASAKDGGTGWAQREGGLRVLDLCTGSGCIGISLAHYLRKESVQVTLCDISSEALLVAGENIQRLSVGDCCQAVLSDLFAAFDGQKFDLIVSNPPYIPSEVIDGLAPEVRDHEPRLALDGSSDGLSFYRKIAAEANAYLVPGGRVYLEIGWDQGEAVRGLLDAAGFEQTEVIKDLAGKDRVVRTFAPGT